MAAKTKTHEQEIDTRTIPGNGGTVEWFKYDGGPLDGLHVITVTGPDGANLATLTVEPAKAHETYIHPFAREDVPDVFSRTYARETATAS